MPCVYQFHHSPAVLIPPRFQQPASDGIRRNILLSGVSRHATAALDPDPHLVHREDVRVFCIFPTIGWREGMAIRANQAQVVELIIRLVAVNVIQFQWHWAAQPLIAATTRADRLKYPIAKQPFPQLVALVEGAAAQNAFQGSARRVRVGFAAQVCLSGPVLRIELERLDNRPDLIVIPAGSSQSQSTQHLRHAR